jgi:hypothetical protein
MVARKLRFEALELRRLFAIDLQLNTAPISSANHSLEFQTFDESTLSKGSDTQLFTFTDGDMEIPQSVSSVMNHLDMQGSPFIVETETHMVVARPLYAQRTTELLFFTRQDDGTGLEMGTLHLDMQVERLLRLGSNVVIFGSDYQGDLMPDLRFGGSLRNQVVVVEPDTLKIVYQASLPGSVMQAIELPNGIAFKTVPIHTLATPHKVEPMAPPSDEGINIYDTGVSFHTSYEELTSELGYLYLTDNGLEFSQQSVGDTLMLTFFGGALMAISPDYASDLASNSYTIRRWNISETGLQELDALRLPDIISEWEYLQSFELSPAESKLLVSRSYQELIDDQSWNQKLSLVWLEQAGDTLTVGGNYTLDAFIGTAHWINDNQILLLSYDAPAEIKILDISDTKQPTLSTIQLSQRLQLNHLLPIGENHLALFGFTPVTPFPIDKSPEPGPDFVPMVVTHPAYGAIVLVDLERLTITDEQILGPNTMVDQPLLVSSLPNHFAYRSFTTQPDWSYTESVHISTIDAQGKLVTTDELVLGSEWNYHQSNGSILTIISANYLEERAWSDLSKPLWRVEFVPQPELPYPLPGPIDPLLPEEKWRTESSEEIYTHTTTTSNIPMDTNGDGIVSPIDVLQVINHINRGYADGNTDDLLIISSGDLRRFDFDDDGKILPTDAMMMIASLNLMHMTFESLDHASADPDLPEEPCFWNMLTEEQEWLDEEIINASLEALFGSILESPETLFAGDFWNWFAPIDPWADRLKQQWVVIDPSLET